MIAFFLMSKVKTCFYSICSSLILTDDTPIEDDGLYKLENIFYSTRHYDRCREMCMKDPVHTIALLNYFVAQVSQTNLDHQLTQTPATIPNSFHFQLNQAKNSLGGERFMALWATVDDTIKQNLKDYNINMGI